MELDARTWVQALRGDGSDPVAVGWQENKSRRIRIDRALKQLQGKQTKWRQVQAEKERQQNMWDAEESDVDKEGEEDTSAVQLQSPRASPSVDRADLQIEPKRIAKQDSQEGEAPFQIGEDHRHSLNSPPSSLSSLSSLCSASSGEGGQQKAAKTEHKHNPRKAAGASNTKCSSTTQETITITTPDESLNNSLDLDAGTLTMALAGHPAAGIYLKADAGTSRRTTARETPDLHLPPQNPTLAVQPPTQAASSRGESPKPPVLRSQATLSELKDKRPKGAFAARANALLAAGAFKRASQGKGNIVEQWDEWRAEFPLRNLDGLADYIEGLHIDAEGVRTVDLDQFSRAMTKQLTCPIKVAREQAMTQLQHVASRVHGQQLAFSSIAQFLTVGRSIMQHVEQEHPKLLWSAEELWDMSEMFKQFANAQGRLPMAQLFEVLDHFDFPTLDVKDAKEQKRVADLTKSIFEGRKLPLHEQGTINLDDFCSILTTSLRNKDRETRRNEFHAERDALRETGFSPMEVEDLRILYYSYACMQIPMGHAETYTRDPVVRLVMLLERCVPDKISEDETKKVRLSLQHFRELIPSDGVAPFPIFVMWMKEVLDIGLRGLRWTRPTASPSVADLDGRRGFAVLCSVNPLASVTETVNAFVVRRLRP